MLNSPRVLVLSFSALEFDGRVLRQIGFLQSVTGLQLTVSALRPWPGKAEGVEYIELPESKNSLTEKWSIVFRLLTRQYRQYALGDPKARALLAKLKDREFDLIVVNDVEPLPLAFELKRKSTRIFLDAHEYAPLEFVENLAFRLLFKNYKVWLCRRFFPRLHAMTTVGPALAQAYSENYNVSPEVITNAPAFQELDPSPIQAGRLRLVHHGIGSPVRQLERLFELMDLLDERFTLDLMLTPIDLAYVESLRMKAEAQGRIRMVEPVKPHEIVAFINRYDIGIHLLPPASFQNIYALPNKFFEFIQARLAVAIWPSREMTDLIRKYDCGVVSSEFDVPSMATTLNNLTEARVLHYKHRTNEAAINLCAEKNQRVFCSMVEKLLSSTGDDK